MKSFFVSVEAGLAAQRFLDPKRPGPVPLIYMGEDREFPVQPNEVCERWLGPSREHIYFIHLADDDKWYGFGGGDFIRRQKDPGRVYFYLTSAEEYWALTGLLSIIEAYAGKRIFSLTEFENEIPLFNRRIVPEREANPVEAAEMAWIRSRQLPRQGSDLSIRLDFSDRFLAKLALGLGHNLLGERFIESACADQLRRMLWRRPSEGMPNLRGTSFWQQPLRGGLAQLLGRPGAWTIILSAMREGLLLVLYSPSGREMTIGITDDATLFDGGAHAEYFSGIVYYVIPTRGVFAGPFPTIKIFAHRNGGQIDDELAALDAMQVTPGALPPKH